MMVMVMMMRMRMMMVKMMVMMMIMTNTYHMLVLNTLHPASCLLHSAAFEAGTTLIAISEMI